MKFDNKLHKEVFLQLYYFSKYNIKIIATTEAN